jgi:hypothetical protein
VLLPASSPVIGRGDDPDVAYLTDDPGAARLQWTWREASHDDEARGDTFQSIEHHRS